ncbi:MAG TPA: hypothetical protein VHG70_14475 [Nocardioidaceae bacterium]|nr:hypothetical protein [Nocardioidaceae bacterium]
MRHGKRRTALAGVLAGVVVAAGALVAPASATHQNCGTGYTGDAGTLSNGHPDLSEDEHVGWAGQTALNDIERQLFIVSTIDLGLDEAAGLAISKAEEIHTKYEMAKGNVLAQAVLAATELIARIVATAIVIARFPVKIIETIYMVQQRELAGAVGGENACNSVLGGDMLDHLWVAAVQRNLASDGPPLGLLLTPTDSEDPDGHSGPWPLQPQHEKGDFDWCPEITLPAELPEPAAETDLDRLNGSATGDDCTPGYHDGFLTEPYSGAPRVTVQAIVRDTIDHAAAHGLPVRAAEDAYQAALTDLEDQHYKRAFGHFRLAYQAASGQDG